MNDHLAASGVVIAAVIVVRILIALAQDFYRPWVEERARERLRRRREPSQEEWADTLRRWNLEDRERRN